MRHLLSAGPGCCLRPSPAGGCAPRARYAHSMRVFVFNSGLFYIRPTPAALELMDRLVARVESENGWDQAIFNEASAGSCASTFPEHLPCCRTARSHGRNWLSSSSRIPYRDSKPGRDLGRTYAAHQLGNANTFER